MILTNGASQMIRTTAILDMLRAVTGSDYKTAQALGIRPSRVSQMRTRRAIMSDDIGLKAASILDFPPEAILLSLAAERALDSPSFTELSAIASRLTPKKLPPTKTEASRPGRKAASQ